MNRKTPVVLALAWVLAGCATNRDLFEKNAVAIQKLKNQISDLSARSDRLERELQAARVRIPSGVLAVESERKKKSSRPSPVAGGSALDSRASGYEDSLALYRAGDVNGAIHGLREFIAGNARGKQAVMAQYWLGDAYYAQRNYEKALRHLGIFLKNHPQGEKTDPALEKLIASLRAVGRDDDAEILAKEGINAIAR